jgi:hypothetical protein
MSIDYQHGLPLYYQEDIFKQLGIRLCRHNLMYWLIKISNVLHPMICDYCHKILLIQDVVKVYKTPLKVIKDDNIKFYMWMYSCGADSPAANLQRARCKKGSAMNMVLYDYQSTQSGKCAVDSLQNADVKHYIGYL